MKPSNTQNDNSTSPDSTHPKGGPEGLLHYAWRHKLLPLAELRTTDGRAVEVLSPGLYNRLDAGPDFFNAKIKVDGLLWVGNVELHIKASDWYRHRHDSDTAYDNVILHVVCEADMDVTTSKGYVLPTLVIRMPRELEGDYRHLLNTEKYPPCYEVIPSLPPIKVHAWMSALQTERLERKTIAIEQRVRLMDGSWDDAYFATLAHTFGFGINGDAFDEWTRSLPLRAADHHRDDLFQVEALFIGQAGLLDRVDDTYAKEYCYLQKKFRLPPIGAPAWRYLRTRPQNFPHVRILQLAKMYHERRTSLSALIDCPDVKSIGKLYNIKGTKLNLVIINTVVPTLFAYGRTHAKEQLCDRAFDLLAALKAEDNHIVRMWQECGLDATTAGDSQALIQLKNEYCDRKECLHCRFGYEFLSGEHRNNFFREDTSAHK